MGIPSMGIYAYELYHNYDVDTIIRVGTAGAIHRNVEVGDLVLAMGCCTNSNFPSQYHLPGTFAPIADFGLLEAAAAHARNSHTPFRAGNVYSSDVFYEDCQGEKDSGKNGGSGPGNGDTVPLLHSGKSRQESAQHGDCGEQHPP